MRWRPNRKQREHGTTPDHPRLCRASRALPWHGRYRNSQGSLVKGLPSRTTVAGNDALTHDARFSKSVFRHGRISLANPVPRTALRTAPGRNRSSGVSSRMTTRKSRSLSGPSSPRATDPNRNAGEIPCATRHYVLSMAMGFANGSISVMGRPKAILG